ncbi:MAG TPA: four helix bundle protein [Candidatus Hydrogenedentes bacterium]|nr:four helix bundle protein [Candidatus Hydrogenedentota bacterium]
MTTPMQFDHERLHVYQASLELVSLVFAVAKELDSIHRNARDQLIRASQSITLNIAEGNSRRSHGERKRFFDISRGSAMECAATLDVLVACGAMSADVSARGKDVLVRIVSMLTRMVETGNVRAREAHDSYEDSK